MKRKLLLALAVAMIIVAANVLIAAAVSGAAFTTFNPWVDGLSKIVCKNSLINCNIYGAKEYVWLNGGPAANGLGGPGEYFFAVLVPGGQPNPNDGSPKNLSDDYDLYTNRIFTVTDGEVSAYGGSHWLDSGGTNPPRDYCKNSGCGKPDGNPPLIRLFPYADTTNPGGVYILAICSLDKGYPVEPRDCKYDAFKVKQIETIDLMLSGVKFHDLYADGVKDLTDPLLPDWWITIKGTDFFGMPVDVTVKTDANGYWEWMKSWTYTNKTALVNAKLEVCEVVKDGWYQSAPTPACYNLDLAPALMVQVGDLDFGNYQKVEVTGCKVNYTTQMPIAGWMISLTKEGVIVDTQPTGADGCYTWTDLMPGYAYDLHEETRAGWKPIGPVDWVFAKAISGQSYAHTFENMPLQGCTPGFWQGGNEFGTAGGKWLWNEVDDPNWIASGGMGVNPFIWTTPFKLFFYDEMDKLPGATMMYLIDGGGGANVYYKAGRSLVAAYLNASWGMGYAYTTTELYDMWNAAYNSADPEAALLALHTELDAANNYYYNPEGMCPISASMQP